jgi:hypothetical protein
MDIARAALKHLILDASTIKLGACVEHVLVVAIPETRHEMWYNTRRDRRRQAGKRFPQD